eukprot:TRINITY_DN89_c0_g1_i2.p1 TRINITY_DN89_c0_g1~~TRINITY_DN89_c0_g1_i2.p1  ORF type:complete len:462 (+),score=129.84 TRINITY_DN89_c0_g1_i2:144-1529(+)
MSSDQPKLSVRLYFNKKFDDSIEHHLNPTETVAQIIEFLAKKRNIKSTEMKEYGLSLTITNAEAGAFETLLKEDEKPCEMFQLIQQYDQMKNFGLLFLKTEKSRLPHEQKAMNKKQPDRFGYLEKRGQTFRAFKERWFVLENKQLSYYKSKEHVKAIQKIDVSEADVRIIDKSDDMDEAPPSFASSSNSFPNSNPSGTPSVVSSSSSSLSLSSSSSSSSISSNNSNSTVSGGSSGGSGGSSGGGGGGGSGGERQKQWLFDVATAHRIFHMRARSEEDMILWVLSIRKCSSLEGDNAAFDEAQIFVDENESVKYESLQDDLKQFGSLATGVRNKTVCDGFLSFLQSKHSEENLLFWLAVEEYKTSKGDQKKGMEINEKFVKQNADFEVSATGTERSECLTAVTKGNSDAFSALQSKAWVQVLATWPQFLYSHFFEDAVVKWRRIQAKLPACSPSTKAKDLDE